MKMLKEVKQGRPIRSNKHDGSSLKCLALQDSPRITPADYDKAIRYAARLFTASAVNQLEFLLYFGLSRSGVVSIMSQAACDVLSIAPSQSTIRAASHGRLPRAQSGALTSQHMTAIDAALSASNISLTREEWLYEINELSTRAYIDFANSYEGHYPISWQAAHGTKARNIETAAISTYGGQLPQLGWLAVATTPAHAEQLAAAVSDFEGALWWASHSKHGRLHGYQMTMRRQRQAKQDAVQAATIAANQSLAYKLLSMNSATIQSALLQLDNAANAVKFARDTLTLNYHTEYTRRGLRLYKAGVHIATAIDNNAAIYCLAALQAHDYNTRFEYLQTFIDRFLEQRALSLA